jgi:hypothetical protein
MVPLASDRVLFALVMTSLMEVALDANSRLALRGLAADYKPIELVANP